MSKAVRIKLTKEQVLLGEPRKPGFEIEVADHFAYGLVCGGKAVYVAAKPEKAEPKKDRAE